MSEIRLKKRPGWRWIHFTYDDLCSLYSVLQAAYFEGIEDPDATVMMDELRELIKGAGISEDQNLVKRPGPNIHPGQP